MGRHGDDRNVPADARLPLPDRRAGTEPIHLGHLDVHQHEVVRLALHRFDGLDAVRREVRPIAHLLQDAERELLVHDVVLGEQDAQRMARGHLGVDPRRGRGDGNRFRVGVVREQRDQRVVKMRLPDRLAQERLEQAFLGADLAPAERAEQDKRQTRPLLADRAGERDAVHFRHVHVEDRQVERTALVEPAQRFVRRRRRARRHTPLGRLQVQHAAVGGVVVDDEQALALERRLRADELAPTRGGQLADRRHDRERERGAQARPGALHPDPPAHHLAQPLADGQPQAGPAVLAGGRGVGLRESEVNSRVFGFSGRHADAGITHVEL